MKEFPIIPVTQACLNKRSIIYGVGTNDADYQVYIKSDVVKIKCPYYQRWINMLKRCYSKVSLKERPTYIGCSVCGEWLLFSNFKSWMITQDWKNKHLDKDIISKGNKVYSPEKCLFVSSEINSLVNDQPRRRGKYKLGVSYCEDRNKYQAGCNVNGKRVGLGRFDTEQEAHEVYMSFKTDLIRDVASEQSEPLKSALISFSESL